MGGCEGGCGHFPAEHEAMHEDGVWQTLRFDFYQPRLRPDMRDLEARDCGRGSTLFRPYDLTDDERVVVRALNAEKARQFSEELRAALAAKGIEMPLGMVSR